MKITALLILLSCSLIGCATDRQVPPSAVTTSGNVNRLTAEWKDAQKQHPTEPAPDWSKRQYKSALRLVNDLESEVKEAKTK